MAATPQEIKKYEAKGREQVDEGLPGWFGTFADMMTLLFAFFVLLAAISTIDPVKLQNMADGMGKSVGKKKSLTIKLCHSAIFTKLRLKWLKRWLKIQRTVKLL